MSTPAKPKQPFPRALATSPYRFVLQIKPDASPEGCNLGFLSGYLDISQSSDHSTHLGNTSNSFTLAPSPCVSTKLIANY